MDLEIAVLHKTINTPQQYFHTESLRAPMARPLRRRALRGAGDGTGLGAWAPSGRARGQPGSGAPRPGALAPALGRAVGARRARGSGAPCRTQRGRPGPVRLQGAGPGAEAGGRGPGRGPGGETAGAGRSDYRSRAAGSGPSARAPRRRGSMSRRAEQGRASSILAAPCPRSSWAGPMPPRAPARGPLCAGRARDRRCARLLAPAGAAVPAAESQRGGSAVRAL